MHEDLINQIANLKQRIKDERELSFSHLDMVHNVLPILKNMELVLTDKYTLVGWTKIDDTGYINRPMRNKGNAAIFYGEAKLIPIYTNKYAQASIATPQPQTVRGALNKAVRLCDEEGGKLQTDDKSHDYWMGVGDTVTACENSIRALIEPLSAATGGQESEAQAVARVIDDGTKEGGVEWLPVNSGPLKIGDLLYTAPPSALAIETAALRKAAALVSGNYGWKYGGGSGEYCDDFGDAVLALIPQDGITELERFGMRVAQEVCKGDLQDGDIRSIVTSLIGEKK